MTEKIKELYKRLFSSKRAMIAAAALGLIGMLMILFGGGEKEIEKKEDTLCEVQTSDRNGYCREIEERLEDILSAIDGVGEVKVMVTVGSTEEYIYAEAEKTDSDRYEREIAAVKGDNGEEALVKKVNVPEITGVVAVCVGGKSDRVREDVYRAVTAALGIPSSRVYVAAME